MILDVLTLETGRVRLIMKGAKSSKRRTTPMLPFMPSLFVWREQGHLPYLRQFEILSVSTALEGKGLICGLYINELIIRLLPEHEPMPQVYALYSRMIGILQQPFEDTTEWMLRRFEYTLLQALGYGFDLLVEGHSGESVKDNACYGFHPDFGMVEQPARTPGAITGSTLRALDHVMICPDIMTRREAKRLMRRVIDHVIGDKPLKSRELF